jgi:tetratricopeptide (TPR) repeat protein
VCSLALALLLAAAGCAFSPMARGRSAMQMGEYEEAARHFREVAEANPGEPAPWMALGRAEMAAERFADARSAFEHVAAIRPHAATPRIMVGHTYELQRDYDGALEAYLSATEAAPESAHAHRVVGTRLLRWGRAEDAIPWLEQATQLAPDHDETWNALAMARYHAGDLEGAEREFRAAIERSPETLGFRLGLAALLINQERWADAIAVYDALLALQSDYAPAWVGRGILLHELGRQDEALASFERAVAEGEGRPSYAQRLAEYRSLIANPPAE